LQLFGRIWPQWPLLEHDAANALEPGLSSLRPVLLSGRHRSQTCSPFLAPLRPDVVTAPFVFSDSKGTSFDPNGRHNGRRRPLSRIRDDRVQRDGAPGAPRAVSPRWGSKATETAHPHLCRGMQSAHTEEELVEIFACRRPRWAPLGEASACTQVRGGTWRLPDPSPC
jgi:hypothetical protein